MNEQGIGRVRASDAEREEMVSILRDAIGEGRLTLSEGEERIAAVYATSYRDELSGHTADLPPAHPPPARTDRSREHRRPSRAVPVAGLVVLAAVLAGVWLVSSGGPFWPVIMIGMLALMMFGRGHHSRGGPRNHGCGPRD